MGYNELRKELYDFYLHGDAERSDAFAKKCFDIMDRRADAHMSVTQQKLLQYRVITEELTPVLFPHCPFYYETGVLTSLSDGARGAKGHSFVQANGWVYERNKHLFTDFDEQFYKLRDTRSNELLFLICGPYNDDCQHFNFNNRPFLEGGMRGIYKKAKAELLRTESPEEREFLLAVCEGMTAMKEISEKFASKAEKMLEGALDEECRKNLSLIATTARRVPWNAPESFYEALATLAFLRVAVGSLEGVGPNTFGRIDKDLISFYMRDLENGTLTCEEAERLVRQFLIVWDCHYSHDMIMSGYADHELENTYTLGGCDDDGKPLFNELTRLFLKATREEKIIFPKIKCRYSDKSPKEYFDEINTAIINGTSTVLFTNDNALIPALVRAGRPLPEALDYMVAGCWGMATNQEKFDHGNYLNLLKPFEYSIHRLYDKMDAVQIQFETLDQAKSFEELYKITLDNCERLLDARIETTRIGGHILDEVDRCPIFSSSLDDCIENRADYSMGGARYRDDHYLMFGLPNIVDSLLAIKELVFDKQIYSLSEYLDAVRQNFEGFENLRRQAISCHGWGDGSSEAAELANRFNNDLFAICKKKTGSYGGKVHMGHLTYTEIRFWGEKTLATPDGRKSGEYFAQGLTPSRLKHIPSVNSLINSMAHLDGSTLAANSVINVILPCNLPIDRCEAFLRATAMTAVGSLQLNCVSREQLLDAQKNPEKYPDLIVRVTGFSAKFTSLSKEWQDEVISRNFYS